MNYLDFFWIFATLSLSLQLFAWQLHRFYQGLWSIIAVTPILWTLGMTMLYLNAWSSVRIGSEWIPYPYHPCMAYLPTFTIKNQPNVGKYTIHGWYGIGKVLGKTVAYTKYQKAIQLEVANIWSATRCQRWYCTGHILAECAWKSPGKRRCAMKYGASKWSWEP